MRGFNWLLEAFKTMVVYSTDVSPRGVGFITTGLQIAPDDE